MICANCKDPVGVEDKATPECIRLFKWSLALQTQEKRLSKLVSAFQRSREPWRTYSIQRIVAAQLLALIEELAVYKYLVFSGDLEESKEALLVSVP